MNLAKFLTVLTCLFKLNYADLKSCLLETEAPRICHKHNESYLTPFPLNLTTKIELKQIVDIDENENIPAKCRGHDVFFGAKSSWMKLDPWKTKKCTSTVTVDKETS